MFLFMLALASSFAICFLFGLRRWILAGVTVLLFVPVNFVWMYVIESLIQPPLEPFPSDNPRTKPTRKRKPKRDPWDGTGGLDLKL